MCDQVKCNLTSSPGRPNKMYCPSYQKLTMFNHIRQRDFGTANLKANITVESLRIYIVRLLIKLRFKL